VILGIHLKGLRGELLRWAGLPERDSNLRRPD